MAGDTLFASVGTLAPCTGANNSTTLTDSSGSQKTYTLFGNAKITTAQADPFSASNGVLTTDGTGDYATTPYSESLVVSGDFTVECWIRPTNVSSLRAILGQYYFLTPNTYGWLMYISATGALSVTIRDSSSNAYGIASADAAIAINTWQHVAWTISGTTFRLFVAGVKVAESTISATIYTHTSSKFIIGRWDNDATTTRDFVGQYSNIRITKSCRYTADFTPETAGFLNYAGQLSGNYSKGVSTIASWRAKVSKCSTGALIGTNVITGTTYTFDIPTLDPHEVTISAEIDYAWTANKVAATGDFIVPSNPDTTPYQFEVTTGGDFGATEPTYDTTVGNTTTAGAATLTCRGALKDPVTIGPKIPS